MAQARKRRTPEHWTHIPHEFHSTHRYLLASIVASVSLGKYITNGVKINLGVYDDVDSDSGKMYLVTLHVANGVIAISQRVIHVVSSIHIAETNANGSIVSYRDNEGTGIIW